MAHPCLRRAGGRAGGNNERRAGAPAPALLLSCVPSMNSSQEVKVLPELGRRDRSEPQGADREGSAERSGVANPSSRRTETGYEALPSRVSGQVTAKLSRPRLRRRRSGGCAGKAAVLTWGDLASRLKGRRAGGGKPGRSEKSAEAVVVGPGCHHGKGPKPHLTKGRTERREKRRCALEWPCTRSRCRSSYRWRIGVKPRTYGGVVKPCRGRRETSARETAARWS